MFPSVDEGSYGLALGQHKDMTCEGYITLQREPPIPADRARSATVACQQHPHASHTHPDSVEPSSVSCQFPTQVLHPL